MTNMPQHARSRAWLQERFAGTAKVGLPWQALIAFLRLTTNPRVFSKPMPTSEAWARVADWLSQPPAWIPLPTERHDSVLAQLLSDDVRGDLLPDAHLAALAIEHGLTLCSTDGDFARFAGVRWQNPLAVQA